MKKQNHKRKKINILESSKARPRKIKVQLYGASMKNEKTKS